VARLPVDDELDRLAAPFHAAERRIRALVAQAPDGDRRALLIEALEILVELRRDTDAAGTITEVYLASAAAIGVLQRRSVSVSPSGADDLGRSLAGQLDRSVRNAQEGVRIAIRTVTSETVADAAQTGVTAFVDRGGARRALGSYAEQLSRTLGRHAVSRGTTDALRAGALVQVSRHGTENPICRPLEGAIIPATGNLPPYHGNCSHVASPIGFSVDEHVAAFRAATVPA
jgi:hypothetical protein